MKILATVEGRTLNINREVSIANLPLEAIDEIVEYNKRAILAELFEDIPLGSRGFVSIQEQASDLGLSHKRLVARWIPFSEVEKIEDE